MSGLLASPSEVSRVSLLTQDMGSAGTVHGFVTTGDLAATGAGTGGWMGGIFGVLVGAAFLIAPDVGPVLVAGSLAAAVLAGLEGAAGGAALGGIVGAVTGHFVAKKHIPKIEENLRGGKTMLIVNDPRKKQPGPMNCSVQPAPPTLTGTPPRHIPTR